jgi:acetyl esterase/lipase
MRALRGLEYARPDGTPLLLDLYLPDLSGSGAPAPLVIALHGGGWMVGDRGSFGPAFADWSPSVFERVAEAGLAVASVDYRLSDVAVFPAQLEDVRTALRWLREHADEHGLDADRVAAWGESAGGHLAALLGLSVGGVDEETPLRAVVAWYAPSDLVTLDAQSGPDALTRHGDPDSRESLLLGAPLEDSPELADAASPSTYVHVGSPPFLLAHGTRDRLVPCEQSRELARALRAADVPVELHEYDADHGWSGLDDPLPVFEQAVEFLRRSTA